MAKRKAKRTAKKQSGGVKTLKYIAIALVALVACGACYSAVQHFKQDEDTSDVKTLVAQDYERCALDDTTGVAAEEDQSALSTSGFYNLDGLKITLAKDATIKYQVNYYDEEYAFLGVDTLEEDFGEEQAKTAKEIGAKYVKIEIIPTDDEDGVISALEKSTYVKQLTVEISTATAEVETENEEESAESTETNSAA